MLTTLNCSLPKRSRMAFTALRSTRVLFGQTWKQPV
jgi:hypothetical protein